MTTTLLMSIVAVGVVAFLYSSVGHAGASGYIATLTLLGYGVAVVRPTALLLNILVASVTTFQFWRRGHFSWSLFWPFVLLSAPMAFLGASLAVPIPYLRLLVGIVLLGSAARFAWRPKPPDTVHRPRRATALAVGAGIGLLAGLTGTGGGVFLTPTLLLAGWASVRGAAGVSAPFILANSVSGLAGLVLAGVDPSSLLPPLALSAVCGGALGSYLGSARLPVRTLQLLLAVVLVIAGTKLILQI